MRRCFEDLALFLLGLIAALAVVSVFRIGGGIWQSVQLPVVFMALAVFYLKEDRLASLATGMGLGLDLVSVYSFFSWFIIVGGMVLTGWWLSKSVLTNRSLPSLLLLGLSMRLVFSFFEIIVSRVGELVGSSVWYIMVFAENWRMLFAFGIEMFLLVFVFVAHARLRGERTRMLTHL